MLSVMIMPAVRTIGCFRVAMIAERAGQVMKRVPDQPVQTLANQRNTAKKGDKQPGKQRS